MNRLHIIIGTVLLSVIVAVQVLGYERTIKAEWTKYAAPTDATVSGFQLYQDGAKVCAFTGQDIVNGECKVNLTKLATNFTLSALFVGGKESPQSQVYVFHDTGQEPQGLNITVVTIRTVSSLTTKGNITSKTTVTTKEFSAGTVVNTKPIGYWNSKTRQYISQITLVM